MATVSTFVVEGGGPMLARTPAERGATAVLLLHGGPGLSVDYLEPLADELADGYAVAAYQQRGQEPSATDGPSRSPTTSTTYAGSLDALGWERALVVGRLLGAGTARCTSQRRSRTGSEPCWRSTALGAVGDGGSAEFEQEMNDRTPAEVRERAAELDERAMRGRGHRGGRAESLELRLAGVLRRPGVRSCRCRRSGCPSSATPTPWRRSSASCPRRELGLPGIDLPVGFVAGAGSPMPVDGLDRHRRSGSGTPGWTSCRRLATSCGSTPRDECGRRWTGSAAARRLEPAG